MTRPPARPASEEPPTQTPSRAATGGMPPAGAQPSAGRHERWQSAWTALERRQVRSWVRQWR